MVSRVPPFYANWDDTHCAQCVLRGIVEHFEPGIAWDWEEWDAFTGKQPGKWTWPYVAMSNMIERGYDIRAVQAACWEDYLKEGMYPVLLRRLGQEAADKQRAMSDLDTAYRDLKRIYTYWQEGRLRRDERLVEYEDILAALRQGYLVSMSFNSRVIDGREGYASHAVLVFEGDEKGLLFHDSNLPGHPSRWVERDLIVRAGRTPTNNVWSFVAYKKRNDEQNG